MPHTPLRIAFKRPWPATRRGLCLWLFAVGFVLLGFVNYVASPLPFQTSQSLSFALSLAPAPFWGWAIVVIGSVAAFTSYCHFGRDRYGFVLLSTFSAAWGLGYLCGFFFYDAGLRAAGGAAVWFIYSGILALVAGFPNVLLRQPPIVAEDGGK